MDLPNFLPDFEDQYLSAARIRVLRTGFEAVQTLSQLDAVLSQLPGFEGCKRPFAAYMGNRSKMVDCPTFTSADQLAEVSAMYYLDGVLGLRLAGNKVLSAITVMLPEDDQDPLISFYMNGEWYDGSYTSTGMASIFGGSDEDDKVMMNATFSHIGPITQAMRDELLR